MILSVELVDCAVLGRLFEKGKIFDVERVRAISH